MADLIAKSAAQGLVPVTIGGVTLDEVAIPRITSVAPYRGRDEAVSKTLEDQLGAAFPEPNRTTGKAGSRIVWTGLGQALLLGPEVSIEGAAVTDQTDAWCCLSLEGPGAAEVLARLSPLDLRPAVFKRGHAARTLLGHMSAVLMRTAPQRYGIMVFRSMAQTAVHELTGAMTRLSARP